MLADRVRMMFGGMKGMKTYNIELLNIENGIVEYIDFLQETGIEKVPLTSSAQLCKVSRYIVFHIMYRPISGANIVVNDTINVNTHQSINPGIFTNINGSSYGMNSTGAASVFVIDLEKVAQYSEIAIENITRIGLPIMKD